jgi:hypothetical protein
VQNLENQNPANTLWTKPYNLYSNIDTEAPRYLEFERWWGGHVDLNAEEIQFIVDELFVGNNLAAGRIIDRRTCQQPRSVASRRAREIYEQQRQVMAQATRSSSVIFSGGWTALVPRARPARRHQER